MRATVRPVDDERSQMIAQACLAKAAERAGKTFRRRAQVELKTKGECWTNAWELACANRDLTYVEGIATLPSGKVHTHAWCVDRKGRVFDPTPGYAGSTYRGFKLPFGTIAQLTAGMEGWRSSILECLACAAFIEGDLPTRRVFTRLTGVDFEGMALSSPTT